MKTWTYALAAGLIAGCTQGSTEPSDTRGSRPAEATTDAATPAVEAEDAGGGSTARLSAAFANLCATCHGAEGRGRASYPSLPGALDEAGYIARVRDGSDGMQAFDATLITDEELRSDYAWLTARGD